MKDSHAMFAVVSDDLGWCKKNLICPAGTVFVDNPSHWHTWVFMCGCDGLIGSASSFSWWAAWMQKPETPKIFPAVWYGPKGPRVSVDEILLPEWQRRPV